MFHNGVHVASPAVRQRSGRCGSRRRRLRDESAWRRRVIQAAAALPEDLGKPEPLLVDNGARTHGVMPVI